MVARARGSAPIRLFTSNVSSRRERSEQSAGEIAETRSRGSKVKEDIGHG